MQTHIATAFCHMLALPWMGLRLTPEVNRAKTHHNLARGHKLALGAEGRQAALKQKGHKCSTACPSCIAGGELIGRAPKAYTLPGAEAKKKALICLCLAQTHPSQEASALSPLQVGISC